jgi:hypothetical protein
MYPGRTKAHWVVQGEDGKAYKAKTIDMEIIS